MITETSLHKKEKPLGVHTLLLYLVLFYIAWSLKELWLVQYIQLFNDNIAAFLTAFVKISVWIVPVWFYIKYYHYRNPVSYMKLDVNLRRGVVWGIFLSLLIGIRFTIEIYLINHQSFHFVLPLNSYLNVFLLAGLTEEIVFRGFILNELQKRFLFWRANGITAVLFLVVHYPVWLYRGEFWDLWSHCYVLLLGLIFGYVYKKTNSLWSVIILHSFHNLFVIISY
ncbi:CPBP family intramembrane glutamic endopeptidase [Bacillus cytotoxicus]|uniref:CPBP family intramembrane glutamic endopeptidase n=1 Tax=Bacillus cytotoxicus TaxID=580165 RepID=UPI003D7C663E